MVASRSAAQAAPDYMPPLHAAMPDMSGSYELYIASGLYDRRYPRPNRRTLRRMRRHLPGGGRFVDIGGGTGRYTLPLLQISGTSGVAHDICPVARKAMAERLQRFTREGRLVIRGEDADVLAAEHPRAFDLALLAFGVLAHIPWHAERMRMLRAVQRMVKEERDPDPQRAQREAALSRGTAGCRAADRHRRAGARRRPLPARPGWRRDPHVLPPLHPRRGVPRSRGGRF